MRGSSCTFMTFKFLSSHLFKINRLYEVVVVVVVCIVEERIRQPSVVILLSIHLFQVWWGDKNRHIAYMNCKVNMEMERE